MSISLTRAKEIVSKFHEKRILVVGDVFLDRYIYGKVERLNPEAPVPILHARREENATGGAGNTAKNAALLGARVTCIGVSGNDDMATAVVQAAQEEGYELALVHDTRMHTIVKNRFIVGTQQLLRVDYEEILDPDSAVEDSLIETIDRHASDIDAILVSDYAKGAISERVAHALMAAMKQHSVPMMVDAKPSRAPYFTGTTYISPNRKEAHEYLGMNMHENGGKKAHELASMVSASFDTTVFLTLSSEGMYVQARHGKGEYVSTNYVHEDEVVDTSGCGDTAAVTILLSTLADATLVEAADIANGAGATVARKAGAVGITQEELLHTIEEHHA
jgi:D-beta-D-heptose 7-phosphate kinase/D-beta-D-heptose 1-phosphate adenosyltransferase